MPKIPTRFALRIALPMVILAGYQPCFLLAQQSPARFALRLHGGVAVMPLQEWETFWGQIADSRYDHPTPDFIAGVAMRFRLAPRHSLSVEAEYLTSVATLFGYQIQTNEEAVFIAVAAVDQLVWEFTSLPVTLNYTLHFSAQSGAWSPYLAVGVTYYQTEVQASFDYLYDPLNISSLTDNLEPRKSTGYGLALAAGVEFPLSGHLYLSNQLRYRWADGSAFDEPGSIAVSFTGYDLSIGLAWHI